MASALPSQIIAGIGFTGRSGGVVKTLSGFKKGHHTVPDADEARDRHGASAADHDGLAGEQGDARSAG